MPILLHAYVMEGLLHVFFSCNDTPPLIRNRGERRVFVIPWEFPNIYVKITRACNIYVIERKISCIFHVIVSKIYLLNVIIT